MTDEEIDAMAKDLKPLVEPSLVLFGEIKDKLVGFALVMPDYNEIFKTMNGNSFRSDFLNFLLKKENKMGRIITLGLFLNIRKRVGFCFYWEIVNRAKDFGIIFR